MSIEVMLVDDHMIVRQGIKSVISQEPDIKVVAEASDGREAIELAKQKSPDVIVMDISLPFLNGLDASRQILKQNKSIKILILSMHENRVFIEKALSYGIRGYVLKESAVTDIVKAIREVNSGRYRIMQIRKRRCSLGAPPRLPTGKGKYYSLLQRD